jgi:hypothetical protein
MKRALYFFFFFFVDEFQNKIGLEQQKYILHEEENEKQ